MRGQDLLTRQHNIMSNDPIKNKTAHSDILGKVVLYDPQDDVVYVGLRSKDTSSERQAHVVATSTYLAKAKFFKNPNDAQTTRKAIQMILAEDVGTFENEGLDFTATQAKTEYAQAMRLQLRSVEIAHKLGHGYLD